MRHTKRNQIRFFVIIFSLFALIQFAFIIFQVNEIHNLKIENESLKERIKNMPTMKDLYEQVINAQRKEAVEIHRGIDESNIMNAKEIRSKNNVGTK